MAAERATSLDPGWEWPHRLRAMALIRDRSPGRGAAAVAAAQQAVSLAPGLDAALYVLTLAHLRSGTRTALTAAWATADSNLGRNPLSTLAFAGASLVAITQRHWGPAEEFARRGLALDPLNPDLLRHLASALDAQGRSREAGDLLAAAARQQPTSARSRESFGDLGSALISRHVSRRHWALLALALVVFAEIVLPVLLVWLIVRWVKHARARATLPPALRRIAIRERRRARAPVLAGVAVLLLAVALVAASVRAWGAVGIWLALAVVPATLWWLWREPRT